MLEDMKFDLTDETEALLATMASEKELPYQALCVFAINETAALSPNAASLGKQIPLNEQFTAYLKASEANKPSTDEEWAEFWDRLHYYGQFVTTRAVYAPT